MPMEEELPKAYSEYYTHAVQAPSGLVTKFLVEAYRFLLRLTPIYREKKLIDRMYVGTLPPGRVLEVGCGDGTRLAELRNLGWDVQGQEVDPKAASHARNVAGIPVYLGALEEAPFQEHEFDAVLISHVLEHVYDPVSLLKICNRLLKERGTLVAITPNVASYGHKQFGAAWRGLEPPRHLMLFSPNTLQQIARKSGFEKCEGWTTAANAEVVIAGSLKIRGSKRDLWSRLGRAFLLIVYQMRAYFTHRRHPDTGEECVLRAIR